MTTSKRKTVTIAATEANRRFSELLRGVREEGTTFTITSHGRPVAQVAQVAPAATSDEAVLRAQRDEAWRVLKARLESQPTLNLGKFIRDEAYDD